MNNLIEERYLEVIVMNLWIKNIKNIDELDKPARDRIIRLYGIKALKTIEYYLYKIWNDKDYIYKVKGLNKKYLSEMNNFIISEYKRFLNS